MHHYIDEEEANTFHNDSIDNNEVKVNLGKEVIDENLENLIKMKQERDAKKFEISFGEENKV